MGLTSYYPKTFEFLHNSYAVSQPKKTVKSVKGVELIFCYKTQS